LQKVTVPKEVPLTTSPTSAVKPSLNSPAARSDAQPSKSASQTDVNEMLRHADESLRKPPVAAKPAVAVPPPATAPKMSEDINKLLSALPPPATVPPLTSPEGKTRQSKAEPPAPVRAAAGPPTASRAATVKRCPPKAEKYCPILEAAINRAWNADTNPAVRQALESAGDSTALVRIVIQPNGEIREIRINTSSGNEPYDRAVQSVLREIKSLPPLPEEMKGEPFVAVTTFTYAKKQDS
jgi:TonB family protein